MFRLPISASKCIVWAGVTGVALSLVSPVAPAIADHHELTIALNDEVDSIGNGPSSLLEYGPRLCKEDPSTATTAAADCKTEGGLTLRSAPSEWILPKAEDPERAFMGLSPAAEIAGGGSSELSVIDGYGQDFDLALLAKKGSGAEAAAPRSQGRGAIPGDGDDLPLPKVTTIALLGFAVAAVGLRLGRSRHHRSKR